MRSEETASFVYPLFVSMAEASNVNRTSCSRLSGHATHLFARRPGEAKKYVVSSKTRGEAGNKNDWGTLKSHERTLWFSIASANPSCESSRPLAQHAVHWAWLRPRQDSAPQIRPEPEEQEIARNSVGTDFWLVKSAQSRFKTDSPRSMGLIKGVCENGWSSATSWCISPRKGTERHNLQFVWQVQPVSFTIETDFLAIWSLWPIWWFPMPWLPCNQKPIPKLNGSRPVLTLPLRYPTCGGRWRKRIRTRLVKKCVLYVYVYYKSHTHRYIYIYIM